MNINEDLIESAITNKTAAIIPVHMLGVAADQDKIHAIAKKYEIPIHFVGLGEKVNDLYKFNAKKFSYSMLGIEN